MTRPREPGSKEFHFVPNSFFGFGRAGAEVLEDERETLEMTAARKMVLIRPAVLKFLESVVEWGLMELEIKNEKLKIRGCAIRDAGCGMRDKGPDAGADGSQMAWQFLPVQLDGRARPGFNAKARRREDAKKRDPEVNGDGNGFAEAPGEKALSCESWQARSSFAHGLRRTGCLPYILTGDPS